MRTKKILPSVIVATLLPISAFATSAIPYIQGDVGVASRLMDHPFRDEQTGFIGRLAAGALWGESQLHYGLEAGIAGFPNLGSKEKSTLQFGDISITDKYTEKLSGYNLDLLGVLKYVFTSNVTAFMKLGVVYAHQHFEGNLTIEDMPIAGLTYTANSFAPEAAIGLGYQATPHVEFDLTAGTTFSGGKWSSNQNTDSIGSITLGMAYSFS